MLMHQDITKLLNLHIQHAYQPVVDLSNFVVYGYEAFLRVGTNPEDIFKQAIHNRQLFELDTLSILHSVSTFSKLATFKSDHTLFVNIFPSIFLHPNFLYFIEFLVQHFPECTKHLVFELNECQGIEHYDSLRQITRFLRQYGFRLAIDDFGKGASTVPKLIELEPEFIKLDQYLCNYLSISKPKQKLIKFLVAYAKENGSQIIIEGLEQPTDLSVARSLGVTLGQGYLLGKPRPCHELSDVHPKE
jgi:EAL domain-containing protein (putative c-di-GMP-specific phosphodiesterase class I)